MSNASATNPSRTRANTPAPASVTALGVIALIFAILLPVVGMILGSIDGIQARARGASQRFANGTMFLGALLMIAEMIVLAGWGLPHLLH